MCEIYIIAAESGHVKIGISDNVKKRLAALRTSNPSRLRIHRGVKVDGRDYARRIEATCHALLDEYRAFGEWFRIDPDIAEIALFAVVDRDYCGGCGRCALGRYLELKNENRNFEIPKTLLAAMPGVGQETLCQS